VLWYRQGYPSYIVADNDVTMVYGGAAVHHSNTMVCYVTTMVTKVVTITPWFHHGIPYGEYHAAQPCTMVMLRYAMITMVIP
jgi:hypothetical protein